MRNSRQPSPVEVTIGQKQLANIKYFEWLGIQIISNVRGTLEMKSRITMEKRHSKRIIFFSPTYLDSI